MMRTDPSKQCNNRDIKSRLGMGKCHWFSYQHSSDGKYVSLSGGSAHIITMTWHCSVSHSWAIVFCSVKLLWDTSSCHSGGHDLSRSQLVIVWWCICRHQASGSEDVLIWLIGGDVRAQPPITQAAAIKIVTVITPSQSENGQISLTQSHHGKVPHTSPARRLLCCPTRLVLHPR